MPKSTLSDTARTVLSAASEHPNRRALPPNYLPAVAQRSVVRSLLKAGLLKELEAADGQPAWRVTDAGLLAISTGLAPPGVGAERPTDAVPSALPPPRRREIVRSSAEAVTAAWNDNLANTHPALASAVASLHKV